MSTAFVTERPITAEEYLELADGSRCTELVRGRIVEMTPPKPRHGKICSRIASLLQQFVDAHALGQVFANDTGVITERGPDTVRGADVSYYSFARFPADASLDDYPPAPPELIFEVKSPTDKWKSVSSKVTEYLDVGVDAVCVIDPERQVTIVYRAEEPPQTLPADGILEFPALLPGFSVPLRQLLG